MNEERVEVYIPKGGANEEQTLFVSVNGVNYLLPKGKTSMVVPAVARELSLSRKATERMDAHMDAMQNK